MNAYKLSLSAAAALAFLAVTPARAINGCSTSLLNGNYAMQFSGSAAATEAAGVGGVPVPESVSQAGSAASANGGSAMVRAAGIARFYMDGGGVLTGNTSVNLHGMWLQGNISGSYSVNDDCTVSFTLTDASGASEQLAGVIVAQGDTVLVIQTDKGTGVTGVFKRTRGFCQTSDLTGGFGVQYSGATTGANSPYSSVGVLILDGQGYVSATESRFSGGSYSQVSSNGTITVNPDCSVVINLTSVDAAAQVLTITGMLSFDEKQLLFVQSDAGTATTGTITVQ
jgi:hypothetical protein